MVHSVLRCSVKKRGNWVNRQELAPHMWHTHTYIYIRPHYSVLYISFSPFFDFPLRWDLRVILSSSSHDWSTSTPSVLYGSLIKDETDSCDPIECECACVCACECECVYVRVCEWVSEWVCVCVWVCESMSVSVSECMRVCACVSMRTNIYYAKKTEEYNGITNLIRFLCDNHGGIRVVLVLVLERIVVMRFFVLCRRRWEPRHRRIHITIFIFWSRTRKHWNRSLNIIAYIQLIESYSPLQPLFFFDFWRFFCHIEKHRNSHRSNLIFF